jgi:hypothetical protein
VDPADVRQYPFQRECLFKQADDASCQGDEKGEDVVSGWSVSYNDV